MPEFLRPATLSDAISLRANGTARLLAGGTDLYPATQSATLSGDVIDLTTLPELRGIRETKTGWQIGACSTWSDIAKAPLPPALKALQQAAIEIGGCQIQNAGTIGGNLCNASPAADGVPPLLVLDAVARLNGPQGTRLLALADFIQAPRKTALQPDEILTAVLIPKAALAGQSEFLKLGARAYLVISIAMVAVRLTASNGKVVSAALAVGACSGTARRLPAVEATLLGAPLNSATKQISPDQVAAALAPLDDLRATAAYRNQAAAELLRRAVAATCEALT